MSVYISVCLYIYLSVLEKISVSFRIDSVAKLRVLEGRGGSGRGLDPSALDWEYKS